MDWKVITINVFYVQLLKVDFCSNDDKSVPNILLCSNGFIFLICCFSENHQIFMKIVVFLSMLKQCTGIPALKITLAHKCMISDVIWHKSIFSLVMSSPGGRFLHVGSGKNYPRTQCSMTYPNVLKYWDT